LSVAALFDANEFVGWVPEDGDDATAIPIRVDERRPIDAIAPGQTQEDRGYVHTLSLRLTAEQYRRLRRFVIGHEDSTGHKLTHQAVLEAALVDFLGKQNP